jgi:DNA-directed RNA polymerase subunit RPC12/RpoP
MKAEFVREVEGVVTFLKDGKLVSIPLDKLSEKDQQLVRDLALGKPIPDDDEPADAPAGNSPPATSAPSTPDGAAAKTEETPESTKITIDVRTWTDNRGIKTFARFVRINGTNVVLNRNGKILNVPFYSLSADDQQYVRDVLTQQGKAALIPGADAGGSASATGIPSGPFPPAGGGAGRPPGGIPIGPGGIGPGGRPPGMPPGGGPPGGGFPAGGFPGGGFPGAGGPAPPTIPLPGGGDLPVPPAGVPAGGVPLAGAPTSIDPTSTAGPGLSGGGFDPPMGTIPPFGGGTSIPEPNFPTQPITPGIPSSPTFQQVYKCSGCNREISQDQSKLDRCPHCKTIWIYKQDASGKREMSAGSLRNLAVGVFVGIVVVVLGGVVGVIGIIVAVVRAVSRPARAQYRRY